MCQLIESIRFENNELKNIDLHNQRFNRSRLELFGISKNEDLSNYINISEKYDSVQRIRIIYSKTIEKIEISPYKRKKIENLKIVTDNSIDYSYKYADRNSLAKHLTDEISDILIVKNGFVTDTSISNVAFFDGDEWITPTTYLLRGIMREFLLKSGQIKEEQIKISDINNFKKIRLINTFNSFENPFELGIDSIIK